ncbi:hypothetical protein SAMN04488029_1476 [Reichenbachiella faecimaris]|uniref:Lipoprotein n=1 Tax=Reichenbachiella faecimaris TaxID=692418 RepID=A0A1W2G945_REIFA|nr:hypothetical protein [Reichenbachiella faecimaris]SMD33111.1 hypothetical protein SAMN04488029_1476 [Reichenbachiella faecimaris]
MKTQITCVLFALISCSCFGQYDYAPSKKYPFGRPNPDAPKQIMDYEAMMGTCQCKSFRKGTDGEWGAPVDMTWTFQYIMNGMGVQDYTLKQDGAHSGSIRQYDADSARWNVHYYSSPAPGAAPLSHWTGNLEEDKIVLYRPQQSPQGYDGFSRLTFYNFSEKGYSWIGEWIDVGNTVVFPFWKIECKR